MRNKFVANHVMKRDGKYYYVRHIPKDLTQHYSIQRLCFSLKTNSDSTAIRYSKSITQRLDDYWFGVRLKNMDVPAVDKVRLDNVINDFSNIDIFLQNCLLKKETQQLRFWI